MLDILSNGLVKTCSPSRIAVVGAGMAGLIAGNLLENSGHNVTILESDCRVGGRIKTIREELSGSLFAEAGAMRIPEEHYLTLSLIQQLGLEVKKFIQNSDGQFYIKETLFNKSNARNEIDKVGYKLTKGEVGKTADELFALAIGKVFKSFSDTFSDGCEKFDDMSLYYYLKNIVGYSNDCISLISDMLNLNGFMHTSLLDCVRDYFFINQQKNFYSIDGGMDNLPQKLEYNFRGKIKFNAKVIRIHQGDSDVRLVYHDGENQRVFDADYVILTLPFTVLRQIDISPEFSRNKMRAIRELGYCNATKIFVEFSRPFWLEQGFSAPSISDTPLRATYYPSLDNTNDHAIMLASYTWNNDSFKWEGLDGEEIGKLTRSYLEKLHGKIVNKYFVNSFAYSWLHNPHSRGAYTHFEPGQQTALSNYIGEPEGRVYFSGEHTSFKHGWVEGAVESGVKTAIELSEYIDKSFSSVQVCASN